MYSPSPYHDLVWFDWVELYVEDDDLKYDGDTIARQGLMLKCHVIHRPLIHSSIVIVLSARTKWPKFKYRVHESHAVSMVVFVYYRGGTPFFFRCYDRCVHTIYVSFVVIIMKHNSSDVCMLLCSTCAHFAPKSVNPPPHTHTRATHSPSEIWEREKTCLM